ncbi:hypothetical protein HaLaN_06071 [Haematococcus lacustris]|uniref:Uncharacterized protein n=1 Tax=Haematococcus lacustris TaxID=44745 RepID=A0A699YW48_HAELA|nr:hypothetical protein HaLaN_06071 [Haematococcus lacustris]
MLFHADLQRVPDATQPWRLPECLRPPACHGLHPVHELEDLLQEPKKGVHPRSHLQGPHTCHGTCSTTSAHVITCRVAQSQTLEPSHPKSPILWIQTS